MTLSVKDIDVLAKALWEQRERCFKELMLTIHAVKDFEPMSWERAPRAGKDLLRKRAIWLHENGKPNDWLIDQS